MKKLIRDGRLRADDKFEVLADGPYIWALQKKLQEEVEEVIDAVKNARVVYEGQRIANEMADVLEVMRALANAVRLDWETVERHRERIARESGAFAGRYLVEIRDP